MNGGWDLRVADIRHSIEGSTDAAKNENIIIRKMLDLVADAQQLVSQIKVKESEIIKATGRRTFSLVDLNTIRLCVQKLEDLEQYVIALSRTHQHPFNSMLHAYCQTFFADASFHRSALYAKIKISDPSKHSSEVRCGNACRVELKQVQTRSENLETLLKSRDDIVVDNEQVFENILHYIQRSVVLGNAVLKTVENIIVKTATQAPPDYSLLRVEWNGT
jgi:hypothetical protein